MHIKLNKKMLSITLAMLTMGFALVSEGAPKERGPLADGELFTATQVISASKTLYDSKIVNNEWTWHGDKGYPQGLACAAFVYGRDLPVTPKPGPKVNGVPTSAQMVAVAQNNNAIAANKNSLMLYATTGPSAAKTDVAISKVELYGRLLNVVLAMRNAKPNTPLTMNLTYPEAMVKIPLGKLPAYGNLRVRFVDLQGHAIGNCDVILGR